jgi:hypothetical protein
MRLTLAMAAAVLMMLPGLAISATSERVEHFRFPVAFEFTDDEMCAFPVAFAVDAKVTISDYYDKDGVWIKELRLAVGQSTWSANGKSVSTHLAGSTHITPTDDPGFFRVANNGLQGHVVLPMQGLIKDANDVGHVVQIFISETEWVEVVMASAQYNQEGEPADDWAPTVCGLLAP